MRYRSPRHQRAIQSETHYRAGEHDVALVELDIDKGREIAAQEDVRTPASEIMMPANCAHVSRTPNSASDHSATNIGPDDWIINAFSAWVYSSAQ